MPEVIELPDKNLSHAYGITLLDKKHKLVKKLKKTYTPSLHGHKTWLSSFVFMDYVMHNNLLRKGQKVLELGCGWGPAAIFCAKTGPCKVTGLDRDKDVFPFFEVQAELNGVSVQTMGKGFEKVSKSVLKNFDLVFGSDVCFWDELVDLHYKIIKNAVGAGVKDIIYTDPGRSTFLELAKKCEDKFGAELKEWYCTEPEVFEGYVLHIKGK